MSQYINEIFSKVANGDISPDTAHSLIRAYKAQHNESEPVSAKIKDDIAVIGLSCQFSGSENPDRLWENISAGKDLVRDLPAGRFPIPLENSESIKGGFLPSIKKFDNTLFGRSEKAAASMDPQQRLFLQTCFTLLESAGYLTFDPQNMGVFVGARGNTYKVGSAVNPESSGSGAFNEQVELARYAVLGEAPNMIASAVSDYFNLTGPSLVLDTACSSSLVGIHLACQSILNGNCETAIAGGVDIITMPDGYIFLTKMKALSPDGKCKTFDKGANGYVPGEGVGAVLLKPLKKALEERDTIYAVIKGSAVNNDGYTVGVTTPDVQGQKNAISKALKDSGVNPETISLVEAHGTGTFIGDPIEIKALTEVYQNYTDKKGFCALGAVKTNLGHTHSAAGIASSLKVILSLYNKTIPPTLNCENPNKRFGLLRTPFYIASRAEKWDLHQDTRRAAVSSFGFGGTNCHVIFEQAPEQNSPPAIPERSGDYLLLSAATGPALENKVKDMAAFIKQSAHSFGSICTSANKGRAGLDYRLAFSCKTKEEAFKKLDSFSGIPSGDRAELEAGFFTHIKRNEIKETVFMFPGQGALYFKMAFELYRTNRVFKENMDSFEEYLKNDLPRPLTDYIYNNEELQNDLFKTEITQPVLFAINVSIARMWISWGLKPALVLGHSVGEFAAACIAGVFTAEEGCKILAIRGALMGELEKNGAMCAALASQSTLEPLVNTFNSRNGENIAFAAINSQANCVLSGKKEALQKLEKELKDSHNIRAIFLKVSHAFHSPLMQPMVDAFYDRIGDITFAEPAIPIISNVTGDFHDCFDRDYWVKHILQPVLFEKATGRLLAEGYPLALETGPGTTLTNMARGIAGNKNDSPADTIFLSTLDPKSGDWEHLSKTICRLWAEGSSLSSSLLEKNGREQRINLPDYPFDSRDFWIPQKHLASLWNKTGEQSQAPLVLVPGTDPRIDDHIVLNKCIVPGAYLWDITREEIRRQTGETDFSITNVLIKSPLVLTNPAGTSVRVVLQKDNSFSLESFSANTWTAHITGSWEKNSPRGVYPRIEPGAPEGTGKGFEKAEIYREFNSIGLDYGPHFQTINTLTVEGDYMYIDLELQEGSYFSAPGIIDGCLQGIAGYFLSRDNTLKNSKAFGPFYVEKLDFIKTIPNRCKGILKIEKSTDEIIQLDAQITDEQGEVVFAASGLRLKALGGQEEKTAGSANEGINFLISQAGSIRESVLSGYSVTTDDSVNDAINRLSSSLVYKQVAAMVGKRKIPITMDSFLNTLKVKPEFKPIVQEMIIMLEEDGYLEYERSSPFLRDDIDEVSLATAEQLSKSHPDGEVYFTLLDEVVSHYKEVLQGDLNPMHVLFPGGSVSRMRKLYQIPSPHYEIGAKVISEYQKNFFKGKKLSILEVGAGTGGFSANVLAGLDQDTIFYHYTDIGPVLLAQAKEKYGTNNIEYKVLNIEKSPDRQGFENGKYDLILASNVLHATTSLRETFTHVLQLLKPGGLLLLLETTILSRFADLIFGITDGWWKFTDTEFRDKSPLLTEEKWPVTLEKIGYENTEIVVHNISAIKPLTLYAAAKPQKKEQPAAGQKRKISFTESQIPRDRWFYKPVWQLDETFSPGLPGEGRWIVFLDDSSEHDRILETLKNSSLDLITVYKGPGYRKESSTVYYINPGQTGTYQNLVQDLAADFSDFNGILNLWSYSSFTNSAATPEQLGESLYPGVYSVLFFLQKFTQDFKGTKLKLLVPVTSLEVVTGREKALIPEKAALKGIIKTVPLEYGSISASLIDIEADAAGSAHSAAQILHEMAAPGSGFFAYRDNKRYIQRIKQITPAPSAPLSLRENGVYLIFGGLGGLGLETARYFSKIKPVNLVLLGRSGFPSKESWDSLASDPGKAEQIAILREIEAGGSRIKTLACDITDIQQMQECISTVKAEFGTINGVINSTGVLQDSFIKNLSVEKFEKVAGPKMMGAWNLDYVTSGEDLDFFILYSGFVSYLGNIGQTNHCSANSFLDSFAWYREKYRTGITRVFNWGVWADIGIVAKPEIIEAMEKNGMDCISARQGMEALDKALSCSEVQLGICPLSDRLKKSYNILEAGSGETTTVVRKKKKSAPGTAKAKTGQSKKGTGNAKGAKGAKNIQDLLIKLLKELSFLEKKKIDPFMAFQQLGLDSLTIVAFTEKMENYFKVKLYPTLLFEYTNVHELADYFSKEHKDKVAELLGGTGTESEQTGETGEEETDEWEEIEERKVLEIIEPSIKIKTPVRRVQSVQKKAAAQQYVMQTPGPQADYSDLNEQDIAIIGMAGKFPDAENISQLWKNLINGKDSVIEVPSDRWDVGRYYSSRRGPGKTISKWAGFSQDIDKFDPLFFNISPKEANVMDPQQRLLLKSAWEALEDAGYSGEYLKKFRTGVFVGISKNEYVSTSFDPDNLYIGLGNADSITANRISHFMDLNGPSLTVDTLCSSAIVAIHNARQSIIFGDCDMALAGAAHIVISPEYYILLSQMDALSPDGRCKAFDKNANGFVSGEGAGIFVLKKLKKAVQDKDHIYAVIKSSAVNHDGRSVSLSAPNVDSQAAVIRKAIKDAKIPAESISYLEAHGTGTSLGDPIEIRGITKAFSSFTDQKGFCAIGSVKSNLGHLDSAAGVASIAKVIMAMKHKCIPKTLHFDTPNPYIDFASSPVYVADKNMRWESDYPLRAGISAFGMGGTNAHMILENFTDDSYEPATPEFPYELITISGKTKKSLAENVKNFRDYILEAGVDSLADIGFTLNMGRSHFKHRVALVVDDMERIIDKLHYYLTDNSVPGSSNFGLVTSAGQPKETSSEKAGGVVDFYFPDPSDFRPALLSAEIKNYYFRFPAFKEAVDAVENPEITAYFRGNGLYTGNQDILAYTIQYALAQLWISLGANPGETAGRGIGGLVSQTLEEKITPDEAAALIGSGTGPDSSSQSSLSSEANIILIIGPENIKNSLSATNEAVYLAALFPEHQQEKKMLGQVARLYCLGYVINWETFYKNRRGKRLSMPTYSFDSKGYWLEEKSRPAPAVVEKAAQSDETVVYSLEFKKEQSEPSEGAKTPACLLLFDNSDTISTQLSGSIKKIIRVQQGDSFKEIAPGHYQMAEDRPGDYDLVLEKVTAGGQTVDSVLYNWPSPHSPQGPHMSGGLKNLFNLAKTLVAYKKPLTLLVLSKDARKIGSGPVNPASYAAGAFLSVLNKEEPKIAASFLDFKESEQNHKMIGKKILVELTNPGLNRQRFIRNNSTYYPSLVENKSVYGHLENSWKPGGTYIVTGGAGGVGFGITRYLIEQAGAKVAVIGRSKLSESKKFANLNSLDKTKMNYYSGNTSSEEDIENIFAEVKEKMGDIAGIFHCAGVLEDSLFSNKKLDSFERVLEPKISGTLVLEKIAARYNSPFLMLFSSISSLYGSPGQIDYAGANAFMDALATDRQEGKMKVFSVNWSYWKSDGMELSAESLAALKKDGIVPLALDEGMKAIEYIVTHCVSGQYPVLQLENKKKFALRINELLYGKPIIRVSSTPVSSETVQATPDKQGPKTERNLKAALEEYLLEIIAKVTSIDKEDIEDDTNIAEYGVDSLAVKTLMGIIEDEYGKEIDPSAIMLHPTIVELAAYLEEQTDFVPPGSSTGAAVEEAAGPAAAPGEVSTGIEAEQKEQTELKETEETPAAFSDTDQTDRINLNQSKDFYLDILKKVQNGEYSGEDAKEKIIALSKGNKK